MEINKERTVLTEEIKIRIANLHNDKIKINDEKIKRMGSINIDDHGFIMCPDFKFEPIIRNECGKVSGMLNIGENFRKFLNEIPPYVNKNARLAARGSDSLGTTFLWVYFPKIFPNT